ncbi:hypothetical protein ACFWBX_20815 [Streptomyces sp. NPDC059991]|uniref:hypothetical protein n=1 Tax=Streptomyces sp. NPDC059991 TaxID=3347028 RepID=UPI0036A49394
MASTERWHWRTVHDAAALEDVPPHLLPQEAQEWCNFTVWHPERLPAGCDSATTTLRKEAPPGRTGQDSGRTPWSRANPAAFRTEIAGGGRRLRLKQFLYDWAFPAADHPALWGSETLTFPIGEGRVVWLGTDYLGHAAASARMSRTTVELSVLEGEFTGEELVELYRSLRPAVPGAPARVIGTPFGELSYWARHQDVDMVSVPTGLFTFHRRTRPHEGDWVAADELTGFLTDQRLPALLGGFPADSAAVFADADGSRELEVIYTSGGGDELRLTLQRSGRGRMPFPPQREKHPARAKEIGLDGQTLYLAYVDEGVGPFDAMWHDVNAGVEARLLSSAREGLDKEFMLARVREVLASAPLTEQGSAL